MTDKPMYTVTLTADEVDYLYKHLARARKAPQGLKFALDSGIRVQTHTAAPTRTVPVISWEERNYSADRG